MLHDKQNNKLLVCIELLIFLFHCSFFGGFNFHFGGSDHSHKRDTPKGADIVMDLDVTLEELYSGEFIEV